MTDEQLMQQALDALCVVFPGRLNMDEWLQNTELRAAIRKRLAQPIATWQDTIKAAHPKSDPEFWPDALQNKYMEIEIDALRAKLASELKENHDEL